MDASIWIRNLLLVCSILVTSGYILAEELAVHHHDMNEDNQSLQTRYIKWLRTGNISAIIGPYLWHLGLENEEDLSELHMLEDPNLFTLRKPVDLQRLSGGRIKFDDYIPYSMQADELYSAGISDHNHRYSSKEDLFNSFSRGPSGLNDKQLETKCSNQLDTLVSESRKLLKNATAFGSSNQLAFLDFLDSFGTISSQWMKGNHLWLGSYSQCLQSTLELPGEDNPEVRYCVASYRSPKWIFKPANNMDEPDSQSIKLGVCLPKACNSAVYKNIEEKIDTLIKLVSFNRVPLDSYKLINLYCPPDKDSPLGQFSLTARIYIAFMFVWLTLLTYANLQYELQRMRWFQNHGGSKFHTRSWIKVFSLRLNMEKLLANKKTNMIVDQGEKSKSSEAANIEDLIIKQQATSIQLDAIEGFKVVSMIWIICSHVALVYLTRMANRRDLTQLMKGSSYESIVAGIVNVETFFTVTGIQMAYLNLKRDGGKAMCQAKFWIAMYIQRYLRFMPMYAIGFIFMHDLFKHLGSGPMWDHATSYSTPLGKCQYESLLEPLLFRANFKPMNSVCAPSSWYLANDIQFLLVTPLFLVPLVKWPNLGYLITAISIISSLVLQVFGFRRELTIHEGESIMSLKPLLVNVYIGTHWRYYELPHNRIVAYLVGLLTGHLLYREEIRKKKLCANANSLRKTEDKIEESSKINTYKNYVCVELFAPIGALAFLVYSPLGSTYTGYHYRGEAAKIVASIGATLSRILWPVAIARLIYICSTRSMGNYTDSSLARFLSSPHWKPWSRMALSVIMNQWILIYYLKHIQSNPIEFGEMTLKPLFLFCVVGTYAISLVTYLLFEYPLTQILQIYLIPYLFNKKKKSN